VAGINSNVKKAEMNAVHLRAKIEHYKLFCRTFKTKENQEIDKLLENVDEFKRDRANLAENVRCNIRSLEENGVTNELLKTIRGYAVKFID
jgi:t-SNARE complex subunit (syntaxin)